MKWPKRNGRDRYEWNHANLRRLLHMVDLEARRHGAQKARRFVGAKLGLAEETVKRLETEARRRLGITDSVLHSAWERFVGFREAV